MKKKSKFKEQINALENFKGFLFILGIIVFSGLVVTMGVEILKFGERKTNLAAWLFFSLLALILFIWRTQVLLRKVRERQKND